jgi:hypothetical protein
MRARTEGALQVVRDLLNSSMKGQLRRGDTIGLWTFSDDLRAGVFPLQSWAPENQKAITGKVVEFVQSCNFQFAPRLDKVLGPMQRVIGGSQFITVILITSGEGSFRDTPFDQKINETYNLWRKQQQELKMPFITVLRGQGGKVTDFSVSAAPWQAELPPLPPEFLAPIPPKPPVAAAPKTTPTVPGALIFTGKKSEPAQSAPPATNGPVVASTLNNPPVSADSASNDPSPGSNSAATVMPDRLAPPVSSDTTTPGPGTNASVAGSSSARGSNASSPLAATAKPERTISAIAATQRQEPPKVKPVQAIPAKPAAQNPAPRKSLKLTELLVNKWLWVVILTALLAVLMLLRAWYNRSRDDGPISLITRSLDRETR